MLAKLCSECLVRKTAGNSEINAIAKLIPIGIVTEKTWIRFASVVVSDSSQKYGYATPPVEQHHAITRRNFIRNFSVDPLPCDPVHWCRIRS